MDIVCHLIKYKKKEEIYDGQSQTTKGCCIKLKTLNVVTRVTQKSLPQYRSASHTKYRTDSEILLS